MGNFEKQLEFGNRGERLVESYLHDARGAFTLPGYEFAGSGAPRLRRRQGSELKAYVIPDILSFGRGECWIEVKTYASPVKNRRHNAMVHGVESRLLADYLSVEEETGMPVFLFVLELYQTSHFARESRQLLYIPVADLETWPCLCGPCRDGSGECWADLRRGEYWARSTMDQLTRFDRSDMKALYEIHGKLQDGAQVGEAS